MSARPTPGPWVQNPANPEEIMADGDCVIIAKVPSAKTGLYNRHAPANAALITEAGTVYHNTGLTPRELADQRAELLEACQVAMRAGGLKLTVYEALKAAIAKCKAGAA